MSELAIFVQSGTHQALYHGLSVTMTALSYGEKVTCALFYDGLAGWVQAHGRKPIGWGSESDAYTIAKGFRRLNVPAPHVMMSECRRVGADKFSIYACSGSVEVLNLDAEALIAKRVVDDVVGLPTIWRLTQNARFITV